MRRVEAGERERSRARRRIRRRRARLRAKVCDLRNRLPSDISERLTRDELLRILETAAEIGTFGL